MQDFTTLFTDIGDFFTTAEWYAMVKWPFWILLCTIAAGGVYCASFGKKTLLNQGVSGVLTLMVLYLTAAIGCIYFPPLRSIAARLPFLSVTEESLSLMDPFAMELSVLAPILLHLMLMTLMFSLADSLCTLGKTLLTWFLSQLFMVFLGLVFYAIMIAGLSLIFPWILNRYAIVPVVFVVVVGVLMLIAKFIFTVLINGGHPYFSAVYRFFTVNKGGSLFTTSALSFLLFLVVLTALHLTGNATLEFANANTRGLLIIQIMLVAVLYIFTRFYNDKKKA